MKVDELNIIQKAEIIRNMAIEIKEENKDLTIYDAYMKANSKLNKLDEIDFKKYKIAINLEI